MEQKLKILVVIPARGGSKGIPRKNLRPLAGRPLISYAIETARASIYHPRVCVTSEDEEILSVAESYGAERVSRPEELAGDAITLDPVIFHAFNEMRQKRGLEFDLVITMQPTSPLLRSESLDLAIAKMIADKDIDTLISAKADPHLSWLLVNGTYIPNYSERLNRQQLPPEFRETGGFVISRTACVGPTGRIGKNVSLFPLAEGESIDIDSFEDWNLCEYHLRRKRVLFVVTGHIKVGLGHVYNAVLLANEILGHEVEFLVDSESELALEKIKSFNYRVSKQTSVDILDDIRAWMPDVVINDCLDTSAAYVNGIKAMGCRVINFEDLGEGSEFADLVINAIYPERGARPRHYFGCKYFILRDDFFRASPKPLAREVREVLVSFGGTDPNNLTRRTLIEILPACKEWGIKVTVVAGFGYAHYNSLAEFEGVDIRRNVPNIVDYMAVADLAFTAGGRTTFELASLGVPTVVIAQNARELTHFFASPEFGFVNLGLGVELKAGAIRSAFETIAGNVAVREEMRDLMLSVDLRSAKKNVMRLIEGILEEDR